MIDGSKNASIRSVNGALIVESSSGYRMLFSDPVSCHSFLNLGVEFEVLGGAILNALDSSRDLTIEEASKFRSSDKEWDEWVAEMLTFTGISNQQKLFQKMALCNVREKDGVITFSPTIKKRGAAWEGRSDDFKSKINKGDGQKIIGKTAIETLAKCIPATVA